MAVRIAIPEPTSGDTGYNQRALPQYVAALQSAGAEPVVVQLNSPQERVAKMLAGVQGVLLPGSPADVDPQRYGEARMPECSKDDAARTAADELLLQDAFNLRKPILAICHGAQTLNVWRNGSLIQDLKTAVNHRPGREVIEAHAVRIAPGSKLKKILAQSGALATSGGSQGEFGQDGVGQDEVGQIGALETETHEIEVNSSHHQAIRTPGDNLRVSAVSPADGVIEAVELDAPNHFVVGVQWHPERTTAQSEFSRAIFSAFVEAAGKWEAPQAEELTSGTARRGAVKDGI